MYSTYPKVKKCNLAGQAWLLLTWFLYCRSLYLQLIYIVFGKHMKYVGAFRNIPKFIQVQTRDFRQFASSCISDGQGTTCQ
jgi:hypothetical protein